MLNKIVGVGVPLVVKFCKAISSAFDENFMNLSILPDKVSKYCLDVQTETNCNISIVKYNVTNEVSNVPTLE